MFRFLVVLLPSLCLVSCAELIEQANRDPRDAPWDPPAGKSLFEQLPPQRSAPIDISSPKQSSVNQPQAGTIDKPRQTTASNSAERKKKLGDPSKSDHRFDLEITHTKPSEDGIINFQINTNTDTSSLKINGEELGGSRNGVYSTNKFVRVGQDTEFVFLARDINGNSTSKTITVRSQLTEVSNITPRLAPYAVKKRPERDAVAIIIGISKYKNIPEADFANEDAKAFVDYAVRALGVKPANIKLLVDADAEEAEIVKVFRNWLPQRVKNTTDLYIFYSGHGLRSDDGKDIYILPTRTDTEAIEETAIPMVRIYELISRSNPRSTTLILDACYSGQARNGQNLVAYSRPVAVKQNKPRYPENFTVITASDANQISSASQELKHGIFSYYLMKGIEGFADKNNDGNILLSEMMEYLEENVSWQASLIGRKQIPQLHGDLERTLIAK